MFFGRHFTTALLSAFLVATGISAAQKGESADPAPSANKIRLLLLTVASKPLTVHYMTKGRAIRGLLMDVPIGGVGTMAIDMAETKHESTKESKLLQNTVGEFDRRPLIDAGIAAVFKDRTRFFDIVTPPDPSAYMTGTANINFGKAQADGYPYVLWINETYAGESTVLANLGTLSAGSALEFKIFDAASGKELGKIGRASSYATRKQDFEPATSDRPAFVADYGAAVGAECVQVYGLLNKQGHLHAMSEARGLGNEVPDLGTILARYEKRFDYDFKLAKGWHHLKGPSKYSATLLKLFHDANNVRVVVAVDLMLAELGQKPGDLNEYIRLYFERLQEQGYATETATPCKGLKLDPSFTVFLIDRPNGTGKEILAFRRLDDPFVVLYDVVCEKDCDSNLAKYSADFEEMINDSRIKIRE